MKKYGIYFILILSLIIINSKSYAEWQKDGNLEWLKISNSAIKQYVFSQDGKSIYVIDTSNVFFKYDIETGKMQWIKNLTSAKYENYAFDGAKISEDADYYLVWFVSDNSKYFIQLRDIETDNIIGAFQLTSSFNDVYPTFHDKGFTFVFNSAYIYFSEYIHYIVLAGPITNKKETGVINFYQLQNDSIIFTRNLKDKYPLSYYFNKKLNTIVASYKYFLYNSYRNEWEKLDTNWTYLYDFQNDSLRLLNNSAYSTLILSNDGKYLIAHDKHKLFVYDLKTFKQIRSINYSDTIHSSTPFNNDNFILISNGKSIRIHNLTNLDPIDTLIFPTLETSIKNLTYSPDDKGIYFSSGPNIYRYNLDIQNHYIKAFFYPDTTIMEINQPIHFYDASTKNARTFLWEFGDGTTSTEQNPIHKYADSGYYDVRLIVSDGEKQDTFLIKNCVYILPELRADFDYKIYQSNFPVKVEFINKSIGKIDSVEWDFGDYSKSKEYNPTHNYRYNDTFNVVLTVHSKQIINEASKQIVIKTTQTTINPEEWKYEAMYKDTNDMAAINGVELIGEKIVFIQDKDNTPYSINNAGDLLWHKVWDSTSGFTSNGLSCQLQKYPANSNCFLFGQDNILAIMDSNCQIKNKYNIPKVRGNKHDSLLQHITLILLKGKSIVLAMNDFNSNYTSYNYIINTVELDTDLRLITYQNLINVPLIPPGEFLRDYSSELRIIPGNNNTDFALRLYSIGQRGPQMRGDGYKWEYLQFIVNNTSIYKYYNEIPIGVHYPNPGEYQYGYKLLYNSFLRLNDNMLIIAFEDATLKFLDFQGIYTQDIKYDGMYFTSMITLDSANFLVAGSINDSPGYAIINEMGQVVETVILPGRYGTFKSVVITPDSNLLLSGYQYVDKKLHRRPYFAKTNSQFIRERISKQMHVSSVDESQYDGNITIYPNPVTDALQISGINGYQIWSYSISNLLGQEVMKGDLMSNVISVSNFQKGMYILTLRYQDKIIPFKFIKE